MKMVKFQPIMDGVKRKAAIKEKVNGWNHSEYSDIHYFRRGKIGYIINAITDEVEFRKFDYSESRYLDVTYEEFHKFIDIKVEN